MPTKPASHLQNDRLFTVAEIAERDRCSVKTVRRAIAAGYLEVIRIGPSGRSIRVSRQAHEHYRHLITAGL